MTVTEKRYSEMTDQELINLYHSTLEAYKSDCYGVNDIYILVGTERELMRRGIGVKKSSGTWGRAGWFEVV